MGPKANSRFLLCTAVQDAAGNVFLSERVPYRFKNFTDNRKHQVVQGDTLYTLAGRYFDSIPNACDLWWAIGDFQPDPIVDPTLKLMEGSTLVIPSVRTVLEVIISEDRREDFTP